MHRPLKSGADSGGGTPDAPPPPKKKGKGIEKSKKKENHQKGTAADLGETFECLLLFYIFLSIIRIFKI